MAASSRCPKPQQHMGIYQVTHAAEAWHQQHGPARERQILDVVRNFTARRGKQRLETCRYILLAATISNKLVNCWRESI